MTTHAQKGRIDAAVMAEAKAGKPTIAERVRLSLLVLTGGYGTVTAHEEKAWASVTFSGTRHEVTMVFEGADEVAHGEEMIDRLPDHVFNIPRQLVADAATTMIDHRFGQDERLAVTVVLLLLEEDA